MLRDGNVVRNLLSMHDAWDEDYFVAGLDARMRILPHGALTHCRSLAARTRVQPALAGGRQAERWWRHARHLRRDFVPFAGT